MIVQASEYIINKYLKHRRHSLPACDFKNGCTETAMIKILIADDLSAGTFDKLNEIPEFEIIENATLIPDKFTSEIKNVDAVIISAMSQLPPAVLASAIGLKIIILTGGEPNHMETEMANQKNIEIRSIPLFPGSSHSTATENQGREELAVITILKDFFNV